MDWCMGRSGFETIDFPIERCIRNIMDKVDGRNPAPPKGWLKHDKFWDKPPINWCRTSSIHSMTIGIYPSKTTGAGRPPQILAFDVIYDGLLLVTELLSL